ncbi:DMT family transporter [Salmonella enterica]|nr:DMT family transporter [Salmonella enterica]
MKTNRVSGLIYALIAAMCNGTVGVLSVKLFQAGMSANEVAFYKCLIGFIIIFLIILLSGKLKFTFNFVKEKWPAGIICSFFGFFILYHFETTAYITLNVSSVVFTLFGSATVFLFLLSALMEKRFFNLSEAITIAISVAGLYLIFMCDKKENISFSYGLFFASIAGIGYGTFLYLSKKMKFGSGLPQMFTLLLFGSFCLFIPYTQGVKLIDINILSISILIGLAILPTIGGFWCTTKALTLTSSQSVQLIELSEPVFAIFFSALFLGQIANTIQYIGGGLIFLAIIFYEFNLLHKIQRLI